MYTSIIYAHPYSKSFNHAILNTVTTALKKINNNYHLIDLYADNFNALYSTAELALFNKGETTDHLVERYQHIIQQSNKVIFIFPVWWNDTPAMIKGFIDKIMKKKFAYNVGKTGVIGNLNNIQKTLVLTTSTSPTFYLRLFCGNAISSVFIKSTLKQLKFKKITWKNFGSIDHSTDKKRHNYLNYLDKYLTNWAASN
ncbi:NAD(P)H-dependent oxidoreductase [Bombilactobacillus thymidiniphilus]|uniref:NAD(P)H-dependent oxidoreductase n=1 Tax=Bombilactobacillus thymidiniphilus TaxID=2923363 RepID=A0ABY4PFD7_9LACO|nr:NAD(P)H-dependent oxidoreductase [Bombilactobacillus thymidiniphilus]UQS84234.1 NAD(P)H-dependent oxidoreductase [Bombilactobacillus thymidiniphilus]